MNRLTDNRVVCPAVVLVALVLTNAAVRADEAENGPKGIAEQVDCQIDQWWPTAEEKRFDEIGWADDIRQALRLAKEHGRPVFLFTMDGFVNLGRC